MGDSSHAKRHIRHRSRRHAGRHPGHRNVPQAFEGRGSRVYDVVARRVLRRFYRRLAADIAARADRGAAVLDVGTGPGVLLIELAALRPDLRLTGLDLSADMIAAAKRNLGRRGGRAAGRGTGRDAGQADERAGAQVDVCVGDVTRLPFSDDSFDLIVASFSLHHWDEPEAAAPELARVLRPGGRVLIYDLPGAPFDELGDAARSRSVLWARPPERTRIRTGVPFLRCERYAMYATSSPG